MSYRVAQTLRRGCGHGIQLSFEWRKIKMKKTKQILTGNKGFTLLEILVVLTIMGFLIAMVAPRLAGISGSAVDTICDTNQNRMVTYMASYFEKENRFPNKLTNLVMTDGAATVDPEDATYQIPVVSDQDPDNGAEVFAYEFYSRNHLILHTLTEDEASTLRGMGIVKLFNLNDYSGLDAYAADPTGFINDVAVAAVTDERAAMEEVNVEAGVGVAMIGMGADGAATPAWTLTTGGETGWGEPDFFGRIVLGLSAESGLIKDGVIANAAHCPGGLQNDDNATYNDYNVVLPRLQDTVDTFDATIEAMDTDSDVSEGIEFLAVSYDEGEEPAVGAIDSTSMTVRSVALDAQEGWLFATMCPEGHMYPADDGDEWVIDLDGGSDVD
jgi:prepilin-type N-terminal cleavage/methylation domain-containing protein